MDAVTAVPTFGTVNADDLDKELLAQLHAATLKASDVCFELKKLCATVLVPTVTLVSIFSAKRLDMSVFVAAYMVVGCFWLADSVGYFYQRKLRFAMSKIWLRRAERCNDPWDFKPMTSPQALKALLNGSMTFYYVLLAATFIAMCLYLTGAIGSVKVDGLPVP